jgi:hypothetical protein
MAVVTADSPESEVTSAPHMSMVSENAFSPPTRHRRRDCTGVHEHGGGDLLELALAVAREKTEEIDRAIGQVALDRVTVGCQSAQQVLLFALVTRHDDKPWRRRGWARWYRRKGGTHPDGRDLVAVVQREVVGGIALAPVRVVGELVERERKHNLGLELLLGGVAAVET